MVLGKPCEDLLLDSGVRAADEDGMDEIRRHA